jgi:D-alanyl-lipoteichoic acid acyltransferase DltB (MBOAT superfamily)
MLFNSIEFGIFLIVAFFLYWFVFNNNVKNRNLFLLGISYIFYGWWDWRFLSLLIISSIVDYFIANKIYEAPTRSAKRRYLIVSLATNLGILGAFKYFNFFSDSFVKVLNAVGLVADSVTLNVILPVGISFYTFQTLSYTIDVYRSKLKPAEDWIQFFTYVTFFPQLVAGPIERATNLLPQFSRIQNFSYDLAASGMRLMLWGYFKKSVVADHCAKLVNDIFANHERMSTPVLIMGVVYFAFQIYGDFSGYSDIARGVSRLFGIELMVNFRTPYFSRDIAEFWRRWHISLTTWFRDYVYIPLGGSYHGKIKAVYNTIVVFLLSGLWHGANWTFVWWGIINALLFLPLLLFEKNRNHLGDVASGRLFPNAREFSQILLTFLLVCFTWIFFRAESISHALSYIGAFGSNVGVRVDWEYFDKITIFSLIVLLSVDWVSREKGFDAFVYSMPRSWQRRGIYAMVFFCIFLFGLFEKDSFIYFQF